MTSRRSLRVGLAGLGRFGSLHAAVLSSLPDVELLAIADPDEQQRHGIGERYGIPRRYGDAAELIADPQLDALVLATPDDQHLQHTLAAVATGKPVFVEKPLAPNWQDAQRLRTAAASQGSWLQVGLILRYDLQHQLLHRQVQEQQFGELVSIRTKRNCSADWFGVIADRVHTVYETMIHDLDLMLWLADSPVCRVMAMERHLGKHRFPEGIFALLHFANGCVGMAEASWFVPQGAPANVLTSNWQGSIDAELAVVGSRQTAQLRYLDAPLRIWGAAGTTIPDTQLWPELQGCVQGALRDELSDFVQCARSGRPSSVADLNQAVAGLQLAEAIVESAQRGQPIDLAAEPAPSG